MKRFWLATAAALAVFAVSLNAQEADRPAGQPQADDLGALAGAFGAREAVQSIALSPSGSRIAYISPSGDQDDVLFVVPSNGSATPLAILKVDDDMTELSWCAWANDERLVCKISMIRNDSAVILHHSRMISLTADGQKANRLTPNLRGRLQYGGDVVALDVPDEPDKILMQRVGYQGGSLSVDKVDVTDGRASVAEKPHENAAEYIADEAGRVRIMMLRPDDVHGNTGDTLKYFYRKKGSDEWLPLSVAEAKAQTSSGFRPVAIDSAADLAYGFDKVDGYDALYTMALDGSGTRKIVLARDDVDVDRLVTIGRHNRVVGVSYATEKRTVEYLDPELKALAASLAKALPGEPGVSIVDASADESRLLIVASSDTDPGMVYLYDKPTKRLSEVIPVRDYLGDRTMGAMKPIAFAAPDGTQIPGYLTLPPGSDGKNLPAIVMPHGGPGARDEWGFDWLVQFLAARGYAVLQPNFRGSSGYGDAWFGRNGFQAWQTAIGDVDAAGHWLVAQGIADPQKLGILGWSYGGYAALQSQVLEPGLFKAVVAIAPVTDLDMLRDENRYFTNYALMREFIGQGPHIKQGSPAQNAERFAAPVLMFHGTIDQNVSIAQSRHMRNQLKSAGKAAELVEFEDLDHYLESHVARARMLTEMDAFLTQNLKR